MHGAVKRTDELPEIWVAAVSSIFRHKGVPDRSLNG
jgi:hypothetical protein